MTLPSHRITHSNFAKFILISSAKCKFSSENLQLSSGSFCGNCQQVANSMVTLKTQIDAVSVLSVYKSKNKVRLFTFKVSIEWNANTMFRIYPTLSFFPFMTQLDNIELKHFYCVCLLIRFRFIINEIHTYLFIYSWCFVVVVTYCGDLWNFNWKLNFDHFNTSKPHEFLIANTSHIDFNLATCDSSTSLSRTLPVLFAVQARKKSAKWWLFLHIYKHHGANLIWCEYNEQDKCDIVPCQIIPCSFFKIDHLWL